MNNEHKEKLSAMSSLLYFSSVIDTISVVDNMCVDTFCRIPSCLFTILMHKVNPMPLLGIDPISKSGYWPEFWSRYDIVKNVIELLIEDVDDPIIWVIGFRECWDFHLLQLNKLIPSMIQFEKTSPKSIMILRLEESSQDIIPNIIPTAQGDQHYPGVRFAIFSRYHEPVGLYNNWLNSFQNAEKNYYHDFHISDEHMLKGAISWLSSYGDECRQHALIGKLGMSRLIFMQRLAKKINLPLFDYPCSLNDFRNWEWNYDLSSM